MPEGRRGGDMWGFPMSRISHGDSIPLGGTAGDAAPVETARGAASLTSPPFSAGFVQQTVRPSRSVQRELEKPQRGTADVALKISCATCLGEPRTQPTGSVARRPGPSADGLPSRSAGAPLRVFLSIVLESARDLHSTNTFGLSASGACDMLLALGGKS